MDSQERQQIAEHLRVRGAELRLLARALAHEISESAGRIAHTEDESARIHDDIAASGVSTCATHAHEHAERARRFAQHERQEQQRWARHALND